MGVPSFNFSSAFYGNLGGVVVSVPATRPNRRGLKPGRGGGFLWAIKIRSTTLFGEVKPEAPCRKIVLHVKSSLEVFQILVSKIHTPSSIPPTTVKFLRAEANLRILKRAVVLVCS
jgi:hypothetical protein